MKRASSVVTAIALTATVLTGCEIGRDGNENTAATILPANTQLFVTAALSPSVNQKTALFQLTQKLPEKVRTENEDALPAKFIDELVKDHNLSYEADVKPWLGGEAAAAVLAPPVDGAAPMIVGLLSVKDEDKAKDALAKAEVPAASFRFIGDYVVFAHPDEESQKGALDAVAGSEKSDGEHLSDDIEYKEALASMSGEHLLLGFADVSALARTAITLEDQSDSAQEFNEGFSSGLGQGLFDPSVTRNLFGALSASADSPEAAKSKEEILAETDKVGAVGFSLYATADSIVLEGSGEEQENNFLNGDNALLESLPSDTLAAAGIGAIGDRLSKELDVNNPDSFLAKAIEVEAGAKESLDEPAVKAGLDFLRAFDGEAVVAAGDVEAETPEVGFLAKTSQGAQAKAALTTLVAEGRKAGQTINATKIKGQDGFVIMKTPTAIDDSYGFEESWNNDSSTFEGSFSDDFYTSSLDDSQTFGQVRSTFKPTVTKPVEPTKELAFIALVDNSTFVVATTKAYAERLLSGGTLGSEVSFAKAVGTERQKSSSVYVDLAALVDVVERISPDAVEEADDKAWLEALDAFAVTSWTTDGRDHSELRLTVK